MTAKFEWSNKTKYGLSNPHAKYLDLGYFGEASIHPSPNDNYEVFINSFCVAYGDCSFEHYQMLVEEIVTNTAEGLINVLGKK